MYPSLSDLEDTGASAPSDSILDDEDVESICESLQRLKVRKKRKERERKDDRTLEGKYDRPFPSAPPPYPGAMGAEGGVSFNPRVWRKVRTEMQVAFPVFNNAQNQRYHEPLYFKTIKQLAESLRTYGITASFTVAQLEALHRYAMTPSDWMNLARACLTSGQYLDWKAFLIEFANEQAAINRAAGGAQTAWDLDMLLGQGRFANQQNGYPVQVYEQINNIATRTWKALPNRGEVSGNLTKIVQGFMEPFSDFVAHLVDAAGKIFGDPDAAMPLIKQLVYEQCTKEFRAAITPYKTKGVEVRMKVCRELGGPLTNAGLAAAVLQTSQKESRGHWDLLPMW